MKKVETHEFQTATMKAYRLEQELAELRAVDPALADKHLKELQSELFTQAIGALFSLGFALFILYTVFVVL
jgi:hypothetical protein